MKEIFEEYGEFIEGIIASMMGLALFFLFFSSNDGLMFQNIEKFISYYM